jgi:hypothetical protein
MFTWLQERRAQKQQQEHTRRLNDMAKDDAQMMHDLIDLEELGTLTEAFIEQLAKTALNQHTLSDEEKTVYIPAFKAEMHRLDLPYAWF